MKLAEGFEKISKEIILIRPKIGFGLGGAEGHAGEVALRLLKRGYKVSILAHKISFPKEIQRKLNFYHVPLLGFGSVPKHLLFYLQAKKILSQIQRATIINFSRCPVASDLFIMCDPLVSYLFEQRKITLKNIRPRYRILHYLEKKTLQRAKKIISIFTLGKDLVESFYPEVYEKVVVCRRGLDKERFNPEVKKNRDIFRERWGFGSEDFLLLFIGLDAIRKGLDLLLKILPHLPERVKLMVVGIEGKSTDRIYFFGKRKDVETFYAMADLFVLPTLYDPGALATLEALSCGTPVITTPFDGTSELITTGVNGFVISRDASSFKGAILKSMEFKFDPQKVAESVKELTWDNYVDCLINHINDALP
ncbi:MAG: glycosyltransferase family 4 protein [Caldimicrobium sp.]|nr:glycosyltransferase family 4 protein [Caldimicrobium sp.]MDW8181984.1 glycosyltransferase family 4 protein [Caldimicrobium sp.]